MFRGGGLGNSDSQESINVPSMSEVRFLDDSMLEDWMLERLAISVSVSGLSKRDPFRRYRYLASGGCA